MKKMINWSAVSRHITGGSVENLRFYRISEKHFDKLDKFFNEELPQWWEEEKKKLRKRAG